jgi:DNA polymerase III gamma/tau subunit
VREVLGLAGLDRYLAATELMRGRDAAGAIRFVRGLVAEGVDLLDFYGGLYEHLRNLMLFALGGEDGQEGGAPTEVPADFHSAYREAAREIGLADLLRATAILTEYEFAFRGTAHPEYMLEFLLIRLALLDRTADVATLLEEVRSGARSSSPASAPPVAERDLGSAADGTTADLAGTARIESSREPRSAEELLGASVTRSDPLAPPWDAVLESVSSQKASLGSILAALETPAVRGDEIVLNVPADKVFAAEALRDQRNRRLLDDAIATVWPGGRLVLDVSAPQPVVAGEPSPFRRLDRNDPIVRQALRVFDADLVS